MEEEDPRLYESPPPWHSASKVVKDISKPIGLTIIIIGIGILIVGVSIHFILNNRFLPWTNFLLPSLIIIIFGAAFWFLSKLSTTDRVDYWNIYLPSNTQLYDRIWWNVERLLYKSSNHFNVHVNNERYSMDTKRQHSYSILFHPLQHLTVYIAMESSMDKNGYVHKRLVVNISNITKGNLAHAKKLAKEIYNILYSHQYWLWKDEFSL
jgi:hypothetical protein